MSPAYEFWPMILWLAFITASFWIPIVLAILLVIWLTNKKRRDEAMIAHLVEIKQALEDLRDHLQQRFR